MDADREQQGKTIRVGSETSARLDKLRHKGQSYDGLITELLDSYENDAMKDQGTQSPRKTRDRNDRT